MNSSLAGRLCSYRDSPVVHLLVGALVCFFFLSPLVFTPTGFGPDYSNHLWLVWQQGEAISNAHHPTIYLQVGTSAIFEPFYGFYGGTLYAVFGALSALAGNHAYPVYVASFFLAATMAYTGMWWLGRQLGLSRWVAHLPAFVVVTSAYYLSDAYSRGAWPELFAISAVPLFVAGAARLLTARWSAGSVALYAIGTVFLSGSHNITLFWSAIVIAPVAILAWLVAGANRPSLRSIAATAALTIAAAGVNAWFLLLDLAHSGDTLIGGGSAFSWDFTSYFDKLNVILDPLRQTPSQSGTFGLTIAAPVAAFVLAVILLALAWPAVKRMGTWWLRLWLILLAAMCALVVMMVMPGSWWETLGTPFTLIQFPYRLAGWLTLATAVLLAVSLRFARSLAGPRRQIAVGLGLALAVLTVVQAAAEMYPSTRVDGHVLEGFVPRRDAFVNGPTSPPSTWYDGNSYADGSLPLVETGHRQVFLPTPRAGQTSIVGTVGPLNGKAPVSTNVAGGPYVARVEGLRVVGRSPEGTIVVKPPPKEPVPAKLQVTADAGGLEAFGSVLSILCIIAILALIIALEVRRPSAIWHRRRTAQEPAP